MEVTHSTQENDKPSKVSHPSDQWQQALWKPISKHNRFCQVAIAYSVVDLY
jgi:hypothetical protein